MTTDSILNALRELDDIANSPEFLSLPDIRRLSVARVYLRDALAADGVMLIFVDNRFVRVSTLYPPVA